MSGAEFDVAVVGTGPSGLTMANILAKLGVRTLVLEKNPDLSAHPKALNIDDEFFRLLHALGVGEAVRQHTKHPISFSYVSPLGLQLGFVQGQETEHNFPNRAAIFQPEFEPILMRAALATGNVTVHFDRELRQLRDLGTHVALECSSQDGQAFTYAVKYLIGADGAHSVCRKQLGIGWTQVDPFDVRHVVIDVVDDIDPSPLALTKMGWRRNFFSMPAANGRRFEFSLLPGEPAEALLADDMLRRLFKPWRDYDRLHVIRKVVHTFRACIAQSFRKQRVFLIGDAAHLMPVFGSQGMNSGARDANNLGWKIAAALKQDGPESLLASYGTERWEAVLSTIKMATMNGKLQKVQSVPKAILRDLFFGVLKLIPPAQRYIRDMKYIPRPFLRSALVVPGSESGAKDELIGRLYPNPAVCYQGRNGLLDDLIGIDFAVIGVELPIQSIGEAQATFAADGLTFIVLTRLSDKYVARQHSDDGGLHQASVLDARFDRVFAQYHQQYLLVRPDRVIAAAGSLKEVQAAWQKLVPLVGRKSS